MRLTSAIRLMTILLCLSRAASGEELDQVAKTYRPRLETNLLQNIAAFWYPATVDTNHGGYLLNHDIDGRFRGDGTKMIVTQSRMVWLFSRLARAGYHPKEFLAAADVGYRFLRDKMWDHKHDGFYWQVDTTGDRKIRPGKHLYGQSFGLYALSEYYLASRKQEALELATRLFTTMEEKAHDKQFGGYLESFNEDWSPAEDASYMGPAEFKLMNTHLHLLESVTCYYRASQSGLAHARLLELITIQSTSVVRKNLGACTDKYHRDWEPVLTGNYARVSYGHDLENIWLLIDACDAAGIPNYPLLDTYKALFDYSMKYGYDDANGGFFSSGEFNQPANDRDKTWWVQAEALVSALSMHRITQDPKYLRVFEKTYDWIDHHQVDWTNGEWFEIVGTDDSPHGDKASIWKGGYHNGRSMIQCLELLKNLH